MFASQLYAIAPQALPEVVDVLVHRSAQLFLRYQIDRPLRLVHWVAQMAHESRGFGTLVEDLNYSAARLREIFPTRVTPGQAVSLARNPRAIANHVYGGRLGNVQPNDGWTFRGRGLAHLTGRRNYRLYGQLIGVDLEADPDLAASPDVATHLACAYWHRTGCNEAADRDDVLSVTWRVNGGDNGIQDRERLTERVLAVLFGVDSGPRPLLRLSSAGHAVRVLQGELVELGYGGSPDGGFGEATDRRLRRLQADNGLLVDGVAGPDTWEAIRQTLVGLRRIPT